jgi:hemoglobin
MNSDIKDVEDIRNLVDIFYTRAGNDALLKPIFSCLSDPNHHKEALYKYWAEALLNDGPLNETSLPSHIELMFSSRHFIRWVTIFLQTVDSLYAGPIAEKAKVIIIRKSEHFQTSLEIFRF